MRKEVSPSVVLSIFVLFAALMTANNAIAMGNGFYMGVMMGPATNNGPQLQAQVNTQVNVLPDTGVTPAQCSAENFMNKPPGTPNVIPPECFQTVAANPRSNQFGARIFIGNQFNTYAAIEGGLTFFSSIRYVPVKDVQVYGGTDQRVRALDVVLKGMFPFSGLGRACSSFNFPLTLYGKLGIAVTYLTTGGALNPTFEQNDEPYVLSGSNTYKNKFSPAYSVGAAYDINQSWQTDLSYNVIQIGNNIGNVIFYALGISYHFTDKYCGQFLCDD